MRLILFLSLLVFLAGLLPVFPAEQKLETRVLLQQARSAFENGKRDVAIAIAGKMIKEDPENPNCYFLRARFYELDGNREMAIEDYSKIIEMAPFAPEARYHRGTLYFLLGRIPESVLDFNILAEAQPDRAAYHWQRGIALYYDGKYDDARKQFELHRTVNPNDVENSIWHFLCVAKLEDLEAARKKLMPVKDDPRVPMAQILDMFAGKATPEQVLEAADTDPGRPELKRLQQLYAHLYIALYRDAEGNKDLCRKELQKAVDLNLKNEYMWEVARVHLQLLDSGQLK